MSLIVQKYGGTSLGDIEKIKNVARRVVACKEEGNDVVVVVSAMAGITDRLINLACQVTDFPDKREYDVLVSAGEQISISLIAMAIQESGFNVQSLLGHQVKIITDKSFTNARILSVDSERILKAIKEGKIIVVAGFQGVDEAGNITTLGRGGSDTTAVAVAAALKADVCEIYTDVEGVFTTDPGFCSQARKLHKISYDEMLEMASLGAKVLQARSVELARKYQVSIHVRSTFSENEGTYVTSEDSEMERAVVSGVTYNKDEAKITVSRIPDKPGIAAKIFGIISQANILVDMIIQNVSSDDYTDLTFTVSKIELKKAIDLLKKNAGEINAGEISADENISKVSIVGIGMKSHSGVASKMFATLGNENINILMISTSEIKVSCVIESKYTELAVRVLHQAFDLDKGNSLEEKFD